MRCSKSTRVTYFLHATIHWFNDLVYYNGPIMAFCVLAWAGSQGGAGRGVGAGMRARRGGGHGGSWAIKEHLKQQLPAPGTYNAGVPGVCVIPRGNTTSL